MRNKKNDLDQPLHPEFLKIERKRVATPPKDYFGKLMYPIE